MAARYLFHLVGKDAPFSVSPHGLKAFVDGLLAEGRKPCTLEESLHRGDDHFTLTFDDACTSVFEQAFPILQETGITAAVFVPTASVDTIPGFMDWGQLRTLAQHGWTIGSHTANHPRLSRKTYDEDEEQYLQRVKAELLDSKALLERKLGIDIQFLAYPYGECTEAVKRLAGECGYRAAFIAGPSPAGDSDAFALPRLDPSLHNGDLHFGNFEGISVIIPAHNRGDMLEEILTRLQQQGYPEAHYEVIVVDDASTQPLEQIVTRFGPPFRYVRLPDTGKRYNASLARQTGAEVARFPVLAFIDSDIVVCESFLWSLHWVHSQFPRCICLGYLSGYNLEDQGHYHRLDKIRGVHTDRIGIIPDRSREPDLRSCLDNIHTLEQPWRLCYTGNFSISRPAFFEAGGFDLSFSGWGLEDLEFGYRCHQAGLTWLFSRFAVGYHITAYDEGKPRNPFKVTEPVEADFRSYLVNLERLSALHPGDPVIAEFHRSSLEDIHNILHADRTVGIEFGGRCALSCGFHRQAHKCVAGTVTLEELLDRVHFARKNKADSLYLLGGQPAEHPRFRDFLRAIKGLRFDVTLETNGIAFHSEGAMQTAFTEGVHRVVLEVLSFRSETFCGMAGVSSSEFLKFQQGYSNLRQARKVIAAKVMLTRQNAHELDDILHELSWLGQPSIEVRHLRSALSADELGRLAARHPQLQLMPIGD